MGTVKSGGDPPEQGKRQDLIGIQGEILAAETWQEVLIRPDMVTVVSRHLGWARAVFEARPRQSLVAAYQPTAWQAEVIAKVRELMTKEKQVPLADGTSVTVPDARNVLWVWTAAGNVGKSVLLMLLEQALGTDFIKMIPTGQERMADAYDKQSCIGLDIPRAEYLKMKGDQQGAFATWEPDKPKLAFLATFLERCSDYGSTIVSARYQGKRVQMGCRCVVVTSNLSPTEAGLYELLSRDRVHTYEVIALDELGHYLPPN